jgi:hypothetical protein
MKSTDSGTAPALRGGASTSASNTPREEDRAGTVSPEDDPEPEAAERSLGPGRPRRRRRSRTQARNERGEHNERGERGADGTEPVVVAEPARSAPAPGASSPGPALRGGAASPAPALRGGAALASVPVPQVYRDLIAPERIDPDAVKVLKRLTRHGHTAYLVGGGVRDLLHGRSPKDFDIGTSARPNDVRRLFRNCRIIGRRFRLAHILFGAGKIIEVATFRRDPTTREGGAALLFDDAPPAEGEPSLNDNSTAPALRGGASLWPAP